MEVRFVQDENEIALADCWTIETISPIETDVHFLGLTLKLVTGQTVNLQPTRMIQTFLPGKDDKPMVAGETRRPTFPNFPLVNVHRSGSCLILLIADSNATLSLSGP